MMKKNILIGAVLLGAASFSMLTGFDSALTAEDIFQKSHDAGAAITELSAVSDINLDAEVSVPAADTTLGIKAGGQEKLGATMDPLAVAVDADVNASAMGQDMAMKVSLYGVTEDDGSFALYSKTTLEGAEDAQWTKTSTDGAQIQALIEQVKSMDFDYSSLPFELTLAPEPVDFNGTECYSLSASMTWDEIYLLAQPYLSELPEGVTQDQLDTYSSLLSGLVFNMEYYVDTETFLPAYIHLDMDGSDWTMIATLVSSMFGTDQDGNAYEVNLAVNATDIDITYDYETPVEIVLPADAAAAQETDPSSLLEMVETADNAA